MVLLATKRRSPISRFVSPSDTRRTTWSSAGVRASHPEVGRAAEAGPRLRLPPASRNSTSMRAASAVAPISEYRSKAVASRRSAMSRSPRRACARPASATAPACSTGRGDLSSRMTASSRRWTSSSTSPMQRNSAALAVATSCRASPFLACSAMAFATSVAPRSMADRASSGAVTRYSCAYPTARCDRHALPTSPTRDGLDPEQRREPRPGAEPFEHPRRLLERGVRSRCIPAVDRHAGGDRVTDVEASGDLRLRGRLDGRLDGRARHRAARIGRTRSPDSRGASPGVRGSRCRRRS